MAATTTTSTTMQAPTSSSPASIPWWKSALLVAMTALTILACYRSPVFSSTLEAGITLKLPVFVGNYSSIMDEEVSLAEKTMLPPDTEFAKKRYETLNRDVVSCQVVLSGGGRRSIHQPEVCLDGQGWTLRAREVVSVPLKDGKSMDVMLLRCSRENILPDGTRKEMRMLYAYWFVGKDRITPHHWERILLTSWDRVMHNVNHRWAYVIASAIVPSSMIEGADDDEKTLGKLKEFIAGIKPQITQGQQ